MKLPTEIFETEIFEINKEEAYKNYLERAKNPNAATKPEKTEPNQPTADFTLEILTDSYRITGVNYRNNIHSVNFTKELLDNGAKKTQDKWVEYSLEPENRFIVGDMSLYHSIFTTLYKNKDNTMYKDQIEEVRKFLDKILKQHWIMTLTRIQYQPSGKDKVIHNFKMPDQYEIFEDITAPDEWVKNSTNNLPYKALLGTSNLTEINNVYNWLTGVDPYLYRLNNKPQNIDARVARFNADSDRVLLDCFRDPQLSYSSLGVAPQKI